MNARFYGQHRCTLETWPRAGGAELPASVAYSAPSEKKTEVDQNWLLPAVVLSAAKRPGLMLASCKTAVGPQSSEATLPSGHVPGVRQFCFIRRKMCNQTGVGPTQGKPNMSERAEIRMCGASFAFRADTTENRPEKEPVLSPSAIGCCPKGRGRARKSASTTTAGGTASGTAS